MKFPSAAALAVLGPDARFRTTVSRVARQPVLYLVGGMSLLDAVNHAAGGYLSGMRSAASAVACGGTHPRDRAHLRRLS